MRKRLALSFLLIVSLAKLDLVAQNLSGTVRTDFAMGKAYPLKQSVFPCKSPRPTFAVQERFSVGGDPSPLPPPMEERGSQKNTSTNAYIVNVGRNFEANHLTGGTPSDNTMAISNDGLIVSVDNYSIAYFKENGDTITQFGLPLGNFYNDSTMDRTPFDPRVIYDRYNNRFVLVSLYHSNNFRQSRLLLSFSKPLVADTVEWSHYQFSCDSAFTAAGQDMYWFDYPNISVTKSQLLVTLAVQERDTNAGTNTSRTNLFLQLDKSAGYAGSALLPTAVWKDIENTEGEKRLNLVPSMDALQGLSSDTVCYLVTNYGDASSKFFWFEVTGAIGSPAAQIVAHANYPGFYYATPSYASQSGGNGGDRIRITDCDIQYCLLQNNKLHFVFNRSNNGWAELVYANIDIATNTFFASTFDGVASSENLFLPSIACYGRDSSDESYLIGFFRSGPNQFPEICAVNYDTTGWSIVATSVITGFGILDLRRDIVSPWDSLERLGDYTCMQRKYNDSLCRCWMVGAHAFGLGANHFGVISGVNAWIAELGDTVQVVGEAPPAPIQDFIMFPNPVGSASSLYLRFEKQSRAALQISDLTGRILFTYSFTGDIVEIPLPALASGTYFVQIIAQGSNYEQKKIVVLR